MTLPVYGYCNFISSKHACIFFDEVCPSYFWFFIFLLYYQSLIKLPPYSKKTPILQKPHTHRIYIPAVSLLAVVGTWIRFQRNNDFGHDFGPGAKFYGRMPFLTPTLQVAYCDTQGYGGWILIPHQQGKFPPLEKPCWKTDSCKWGFLWESQLYFWYFRKQGNLNCWTTVSMAQ